jgi:putative nucleotidyltransferase with HDIG domain
MTAKLPDKVLELLQRTGEVYEVGGSVRDRLLEREPLDYDYLVRGIALPELVDRLRTLGYADWVGRSFGVIKFTFDTPDGTRATVDMALPRSERSTGPGHRDFEVTHDPDLPVEADLGRRDFTVNAMAVRLSDGVLIDPHGGRADLAEKRLRLVFPDALEEDPLRILRALGLVARLGLRPDLELLSGLRRHAPQLSDVSPERVAEEFSKLLVQADQPSSALRLMRDTGALAVLLPEMVDAVGCDQPGPYHAYDVFEHTCHTVDAAPPRLAVRWAALLHDVSKPATREFREGKLTFYNHEHLGAAVARRVLARLRYGRELEDHVAILVERHLFNTDMGDRGLRRLIRAVGPERMGDLIDLRRADVSGQGMGAPTDDVDRFQARVDAEISARHPFSRADLAVDGHALMTELGLPPGPRLGKILDHLLERVLDEPEHNQRATLLAWAREYLHLDTALVACALLGLAHWGG